MVVERSTEPRLQHRKMSILNFFKRKNGLSDPNGSLSTVIPSHAITLANIEVERVISEETQAVKKQGKYKT